MSFVQEELLENPVLEFENKYKSEKTLDIREKFMEDYGDGRYEQWENPGGSDKEEFSYEQFVTKEETLEDYLLLQLTFSRLKDTDLKIGRYLVEAIDDNGTSRLPSSRWQRPSGQTRTRWKKYWMSSILLNLWA